MAISYVAWSKTSAGALLKIEQRYGSVVLDGDMDVHITSEVLLRLRANAELLNCIGVELQKHSQTVRLLQIPVRGRTFVMKFLHVSGLITMGVCLCVAAPGAAYRSPLSVAVSPDGKTLYVSDKTAGCVTSLDAATFSTNSAASGDPLAFASSSELIPS